MTSTGKKKSKKPFYMKFVEGNKKQKVSKQRKPSIMQRFQGVSFDDSLKDIDVTGKSRIAISDMKKDTLYYEAKNFTAKYGLTKSQIKRNAKLFTKQQGKVVLVKIALANGLYREFLVGEEAGYFIFNKGLYVFDLAFRYYIIERKIWAYDFHEFLSIPLKRKFVIGEKLDSFLSGLIDGAKQRPLDPVADINTIKTLIENSEVVDVEASINPTTLKRFTDSEVIKQVLQGAMLGKIFKIMFVMIIIIAVFMLFLIVIQLYTTGIFDSLMEKL